MTGDEKDGSIFRILNARNLELIPPKHQHLPQDQIASDGRWCCAFGQERVIYYELLKPSETVNAHCYHQQLIRLHRALREKRLHYRKRHDKLIFLHDNAISHTSTMSNTSKLGDTQLGSATPFRLLTNLAPSDYHLFSSMDRARWAALRFLRRRPKMAWWVPRKMRNFFGVVYTNCPKDGKNVYLPRASTMNKFVFAS